MKLIKNLTSILFLISFFSFPLYGQDNTKVLPKRKIAIQAFSSDASNLLNAQRVSRTIEKRFFQDNSFILKELNPSNMVLKSIRNKMKQLNKCKTVDCAIELGKILAVNYLVTGEVYSENDILVVSIKIIDVQKEKVIILDSINVSDQEKLSVQTESFISNIITDIRKIEKGSDVDLKISAGAGFVVPSGHLATKSSQGLSSFLSIGLKDIFFRNLCLGGEFEYIALREKKNETHHAILMPFSLYLGYQFELNNSLYIIPVIYGGISYNRLYSYLNDTSTDYEVLSNYKPFLQAEIQLEYKINQIAALRLNNRYASIYESKGQLNYYSLSVGASLSF